MKRYLVTIVLIAVVAIASVEAGQGAVRVPFDSGVGWVNLNTTASGRLIATAHVQGGLPDEQFFVSVRVRYEDQTTDIFADIAMLTTNRRGNGNVQVQVELNPPEGSTVLRRVAVRVRRAPNPLYLAVAWDLPLK